MAEITIVPLSTRPEMLKQAAGWFHEKWGIPESAYRESMAESLQRNALVPSWYLALDNGAIVGGLGVIENDFHDRKDLRPNVCAVYVEEAYRGHGLAGQMLSFVTTKLAQGGIDTLYLLTDHTGFYERYGWEFFCMAQGDGEDKMSRLYKHRMKPPRA